MNLFFKGKGNRIGNVVINIGGKFISNDGIMKAQKFDERKSADCSKITKITIDATFGSVNVNAVDSSNVEAHLSGEAIIDGELKFDVIVENSELKIELSSTGNFFNGNMNLDITIPKKMFKKITLKSVSASFDIEGATTDALNVKTTSGYLNSNVTANKFDINTISGFVKMNIYAKKDIEMKVSTINGFVSVELDNISELDLTTKSISGKIANRYKEDDGYFAKVDISTVSGDIEIS